MPYTCPKDPTHQSDDADYCSVCGAKISGSAPPAADPAPAAAAPTTSGAEVCPDCSTQRRAGARFCEVCRHDFNTGESGTAVPAPAADVPAIDLDPAPVPMAAVAVAPEAAPDAAATPAATSKFEVVITVDPSLYADPDPAVPCPTDEPAKTFPLDLPEMLIGRTSVTRDIHPEIPLADTGVSHRHAKIVRKPDDSLVLIDLGSTNGTQLNDVDVVAGVRTPLAAGDQITLGCWTRMTIRPVGG